MTRGCALGLLLLLAISGAYAGRGDQRSPRGTVPAVRSRPLLVLQTATSTAVESLAFSPDGRIVAATQYHDNSTRLWDTRTGELRSALKGAFGGFSPDGTMMGTLGSDGVVRLWDARTARLQQVLPGHEEWVGVLRFSRDGARLATQSVAFGGIISADQDGGRLRFIGEMGRGAPRRGGGRGRPLLEAAPVIHLWDPRNGRLIAHLRHPAPVNSFSFSADGRLLASASSGDESSVRPNGLWQLRRKPRETRIWNARTGDLITVLDSPAAAAGKMPALAAASVPELRVVAFSPDGRTLISGGGQAFVWDVATHNLRGVLTGHEGELTAAAFSLDGQTLVTVADRIRLWDVRTQRLRAVLDGDVRGIASERIDRRGPSFRFSPDGRTLLTCKDDTVWLWDTQRARLKATVTLHRGRVDDAVFGPDSKALAIATVGQVRLYDLETGQIRWSLPGSGAPLGFSSTGKQLAFGGLDDDGSLQVCETANGEVMRIALPTVDCANGFAYSPDGNTLAAVYDGDLVRLWGVPQGRLKATIQAHPALLRAPGGTSDEREGLFALVFSPDGKTLATGCRDEMVALWDAGTGAHRATLQWKERNEADLGWWTLVLAFSADSKRVATGSGDGTVRVWNTRSGQLITLVAAHEGKVRSIAFSNDGSMLATGGVVRGAQGANDGGDRGDDSGEARVWDTASGRLRLTLPHGHRVDELAFSPNGKILATSEGGTVRIWDIATSRVRVTVKNGERVCDLGFSPDGRSLIVRAGDGAMRCWDVGNGTLRARLNPQGYYLEIPPAPPAFSASGKRLVTSEFYGFWCYEYQGTPDNVVVWDLAARAPDRTWRAVPLSELPGPFRRPALMEGPATTLYDPRDGHVLATLLPIPSALSSKPGGKPIEVDARPIEVDARPIEVDARPIAVDARGNPQIWDEWFVATPEGYFDCSAHAARYATWNVDGQLFPAERYMKRFRRPDLVRKALRGEKITAPGMSLSDVPPTARFVGLRDKQTVGGPRLAVTVEARGSRPVAGIELLLNGRPTLPAEARPTRVVKSVAGEPNPLRPSVTRFTYSVTLPAGGGEVRLRAIASDQQELSSEPAQVVLRRNGPTPLPGRLLVLAVGVSRYRQETGGGASSAGGRGRVGNLRFAAGDAKEVAARFRGAKAPLYAGVEVRTLTDAQATLANLRAGLKWLEQSVRPGQGDTVVLYLSGHGYSTATGTYGFAPYDFDPKNPKVSSLTSGELKEALGGRLRAGKVFLFVDTCHAGALSCRNDDLAIEVGAGVYLLASAGVGDSAYESPEWKHGAFTLALLKSMSADNDRLEADGRISFVELATGVQRELAALLRKAERNEREQTPCVFFSGLDAGAPVVGVGTSPVR